MKRLPYISAVLIGANAILSQTIFVRELLVNFSGNELSMGIILATWLAGASLGSLVLGRCLIERIKKPCNALLIILPAISLLIPVSVFLSRTIRYLLHIPVYEMLGPGHIFFICAILLIPISSLLSFAFLICCKMIKSVSLKDKAAGTAYVLEAAGAATAGALFTFLLASRFGHFQIAFGLILVNILFAVILSDRMKIRLSYLLLFILVGISSIKITAYLDKESQKLQWAPYKIVDYQNSQYGNISVTGTAGTFNVYENGTLLFTTQDKAFDEEFSHLAMLQHPAPKNVLFIGNGIGGALREALKHNPESLTYLQLDAKVLEVSREFLPAKERAALSDPRLDIVYADAGFFLKRTKDKFDIIIINMPDPVSLNINRFYTKEFYKTTRSSLNKNGILVTRISSKESIISNELARYNASVYKTLKSVFDYVEFIPGENLIFTASESPGVIPKEPEILTARFNRRNIKTDFFNAYNIADRYYPDTVNYFLKRLDKQYASAGINTDFRPICFHYGLILWNIKFNPGLSKFLNLITDVNPITIVCAAILFLICGICVVMVKKEPSGYLVRSSIGVSGASGITLEVVILLSFQITYGYVYLKAGFLIALFMLGLAFGSYIINSRLDRFKNHYKLFRRIILIFALYIISVPYIIKFMRVMPLKSAEYIFYIMVFAGGLLTGCQFPVAVSILKRLYSQERAVSAVWGYDLLGAGTGTLCASIIIIPVLGMPAACFTGAGFCAINLILLSFHQRLRQ